MATGAVPAKHWMDFPVTFKPGNYAYPAKKDKVEYLDSQKGLHFPNAREWSPEDDDWKLPENWKEIIIDGLGERLEKFRSLKIFMDCCVRCGACADKCHFYLGTGDPKNMPVLRAELLRSVYRNDFTLAGKILGKMAGGREMTVGVLKEWFMYSYQCTECRRCSVFCPYGIDTAEISMAAREIMDRIGVGQKYCNEIIGKVYKIGNNLGLPQPALEDTLEGLEEEVERLTELIEEDAGTEDGDVRAERDALQAELALRESEVEQLRGVLEEYVDQIRAAQSGGGDAAEIEARSVQHFEELVGAIPNFNWSGDGHRARYFQIRGVGELEQYEGAPNPSVGFLIDDIDFSGIGMHASLFDVQSVEVLRGPQAAIYGSKALAGEEAQ